MRRTQGDEPTSEGTKARAVTSAGSIVSIPGMVDICQILLEMNYEGGGTKNIGNHGKWVFQSKTLPQVHYLHHAVCFPKTNYLQCN